MWTRQLRNKGIQGIARMEGTSPPPPPSAAARRSGRATAALVLGIVGVLVFPVVCSTLAIIFGALALRDMGTNENVRGRPMAWWGLGLGIAGLLLGIALIAYRFA